MATEHDPRGQPGPSDTKPDGRFRTFGILNVIFGGLLFVCGPCPGVSMVALPSFLPYLEQQQARVQERIERERRAEIDALAEQEAKAETEERKASLRAERIARESRPAPVVRTNGFDAKAMGLDDPRVRIHYGVDAATCVVVNGLLLVAGVGLLRGSRWGRGLTLWTARLKILRLLLLTASALFVVQPLMSNRMAENVKAAAEPGAPDGADAAAVAGQRVLRSILSLVTLAFCLAYPVVLLVFLGRPAAPGETSAPSHGG